MTQERADLGFADTLDEFNPADWLPRAATANDKPPKAATTEAAAAAGFRSREAKPPAADGRGDRPQATRGRRTGRSVQLNLKVRQETVDAFYAIADHQGWGLGETLEHAVVLLEREYVQKAKGAQTGHSEAPMPHAPHIEGGDDSHEGHRRAHV